jgi:hypothetical protein
MSHLDVQQTGPRRVFIEEKLELSSNFGFCQSARESSVFIRNGFLEKTEKKLFVQGTLLKGMAQYS